MTSDATNGLLISMIPLVVLFLITIVFTIYKHSKRDKNKNNSRETDALIQAQALAAQYKKEAEGELAEKSENKTEDKPSKIEDKPGNKAEEKSDSKTGDKFAESAAPVDKED